MRNGENDRATRMNAPSRRRFVFFLVVLVSGLLSLMNSFGVRIQLRNEENKGHDDTSSQASQPSIRDDPVRENWLTNRSRFAPNSQVQYTTWRNPADTAPVPPNASANPALVPRLITVFGLESSGTTFTASFLAEAIGMVQFRQGIHPLPDPYGSTRNVVLHLSLPWGRSCVSTPNRTVVPVLFPDECLHRESSEGVPTPACQELGFTVPLGKEYPPRFFVNITSHLKWYRQRGVDARAVVVVRDSTISLLARYDAGHCKDKELAALEEALGIRLIHEAMATFVLNSNETVWRSSPLLSGGGLVLVSYESMLRLEKTYIELLYKALDIDSNYMPDLLDGNEKYVQAEVRGDDQSTVSKDPGQTSSWDRQSYILLLLTLVVASAVGVGYQYRGVGSDRVQEWRPVVGDEDSSDALESNREHEYE